MIKPPKISNWSDVGKAFASFKARISNITASYFPARWCVTIVDDWGHHFQAEDSHFHEAFQKALTLMLEAR